MIYTTTIQIDKSNKFYSYFDEIAHEANDLYNAILFRERQLFFSNDKLKQEMSENERLVRAEAGRYTEKTGYELSDSGFAGYEFLCGMTALNHNSDRYAEHIPSQTAENVIREVCEQFIGFFNSCKVYRENPSVFTGRPKPPKYLSKGGIHAYTISNQVAELRTNKKGHMEIKLPLIKKPMPLGNIKLPKNMKFSLVQVSPHNGRYQIGLVFNDGVKEVPVAEKSERIVGIDIGVDNMMAVVNNFGAECMIFNGHIMKAYNQIANKRISKIVSRQTKGTTDKFVPTDDYYEVLNKRQNCMSDYILKTSKMLIDWCTEQCVDTVVIGHSAMWKDKCPFKDKETQNFVQIPFDNLINAIKYRCERNGIKLVVKEESYTSKASFLDGDFIPTYNKSLTKEDHKIINKTFSGTRPHRGIYVSKNGTKINADLNGAANILRKAFPDAFEKGVMPNFNNLRYVIHPDYENRKVNQEKQRKAKEVQNDLDFKALLYFHQR